MKSGGFTLIETMVVIVLLAICATVSTPVFTAWRVRDQVDARANAMLGTLAYARNEAIRRKSRVTVCRVDAAHHCLEAAKACPSGIADWSCGWAVMIERAGASIPLRIQPALDAISVASGLAAVTFSPPAGQTVGSLRNFEIAPRAPSAAQRGAGWRRCIRIAQGGRARISDGACTGVS